MAHLENPCPSGKGKLRKRWKNTDGKIFEWDREKGELEKYNSRGKHLGAFDPNEGYQRGDPIKGRSIKKYL